MEKIHVFVEYEIMVRSFDLVTMKQIELDFAQAGVALDKFKDCRVTVKEVRSAASSGF